MFDLASIVTYVAVVIGLFLIPGPAVLLVITRTLQGGRKVGIATGLGVATGDLIHTLSAALGLSAILMTSALAFNVVKTAGACYLIYLGARAFCSIEHYWEHAIGGCGLAPGLFPGGGRGGPEPENRDFLPRIPAAVHSPGIGFVPESIRGAGLDLFGAQCGLYQPAFNRHSPLEPVPQGPFKAASLGRQNHRYAVCRARGESGFSAAVRRVWP